MAGVVATLSRPLQHDAGQIRRRAQELVSNPPYADDGPGVVARLLGWVGDRIASSLAGGGLGQVAGMLAWVVAIVAVAVLVGIVVRLTRGTVTGTPLPPVRADTQRLRTAAAWHRDADAYEAQGRYTDALRARYAALVVSLLERDIIVDRPSRTVGELGAEVARVRPAIAAEVLDAGDRFQNGVYGRLPVDNEDLDRVRAAAYAAASSVGTRRPAVTS